MQVKVTLDNTLGAAFLGASAACLLFGLTIVQTQLYYHNFSKDWAFQKISVAVLLTLATCHLIFTLHATYFYLIVNFGNLAALEYIIWSFKLQLLISTCTALFVQSLYAMRVWKLGRQFSRFWPGLVASIVAGAWAVGSFAIAKSYNQTNFMDLGSMRKVIYAAPAIATCVDVIIATALCYYLRRSRSSFIGGTNNKILVIMRYVLITGFLTSACSLSALIAYATMPNNLVFAGIGLLLPNLYINSYLSMLNVRKSMNEQETFSVDAANILTTRSGASLPRNDGNLLSVKDKMGSDGFLLSTARFSKRASEPQGKSSRATSTHRIIERHNSATASVFPLWISRSTSELGHSDKPADTGDFVAQQFDQDEARRI